MREEFNIILDAIHSPKHVPPLDTGKCVTDSDELGMKIAYMFDRRLQGARNAIRFERSTSERTQTISRKPQPLKGW